jgi:cytoskeletal protein RodZ
MGMSGGDSAFTAAEAAHFAAEPSGVLVAPPTSEKVDARVPPRRHPTTVPAVVAVLGVLVFFALRPLWQPPSESSSPAHAESSPTVVGPAEPPPASKDPPLASVAPSASELGSAAPVPSAAPPTKAVTSHGPSQPHPVPPASPRKTGCDPPFTIDSAGHKHYKEECL